MLRRVSLDVWGCEDDPMQGCDRKLNRLMQDTPTPPMEQVRPGAGVAGYTVTPNGNLVRRRAL